MESRRDLAVVLLGSAGIAIAITLALWLSGGLSGGFVADDFNYVGFGRALAPTPFLDSLRLFWLELPGEVGFRFYRPLVGLGFAWNWQLAGAEPIGYRLVNLALHVANAWLIVAITRRLTGSVWICVGAGWLFAFSPAHPESLLWLASRVNLQALFFILLALWAFMARASGRRWCGALWVVASVAALSSKETALVLPPLLFAYSFIRTAEAWRQRLRRAWLATWPIWVVLVPYFLVRRHVVGEFFGGYRDQAGTDLVSVAYLADRLSLLRLLLSPASLESTSVVVKYALLIAHLTVLAGGALAWRRRGGTAHWFVLAWIALTFVPLYRVSIVEATLQNSRHLYDPTAALTVLLGIAVAARARAGSVQWARIALVGLGAAYPIVLLANCGPWLTVGRGSVELERRVRAAAPEIEDRWIVDLPSVYRGAYFMLGDANPFATTLSFHDVELAQRVHGVRARQFEQVLREADRRIRAGTAADWDLWRFVTVDGTLHRERVATGLPLEHDGLTVRAARTHRIELVQGRLDVQLLVHNPGPDSAELECVIELDQGGRAVSTIVARPIPTGVRAIRLAGPELDGRIERGEAACRLTVGRATIELGAVRIR